jgi:hypothetical protein
MNCGRSLNDDAVTIGMEQARDRAMAERKLRAELRSVAVLVGVLTLAACLLWWFRG